MLQQGDHAEKRSQFPEGPDLQRRMALTLKETAAVLGVSERHLRSRIHELPVVRLGARQLIPVDALRRWLDREAAGTRPSDDPRVAQILRGVR